METMATFPERFGFSLREVPLTLWEVTPWSFLIDYFVPVGDFLRSWCYMNFPFKGVQRTTFREVRHIGYSRITSDWFPMSECRDSVPGYNTVTYGVFRREKMVQVPPAMSLYVKGLDELSLKQFANMTALAVANRSRFFIPKQNNR